MLDLIANADSHTLNGAFQVAIKGAQNATGPMERKYCLELATQINDELSRRELPAALVEA